MSGKLIIFEGGEGSGKTTLIKNLAAELQSEGSNVLTTREPGGTPFGEEVREALIRKRERTEDMPTPRAQLLGHYTARMNHLERLVIPALQAGETVLCDRFEVSSFVYQVYSQDKELMPLFNLLHTLVLPMLEPFRCTYVLCDIDPVEGLQRVAGRQETKTAFDDMHLEFHKQVYAGMFEASKYFDPHYEFVTIDASKDEASMVLQTRAKLLI